MDEKKVTQRDESVRVELTFTKDEMALMKKAQELLSNKTGGAFKNTLLEMAQRTINSYKPKPSRGPTREAARGPTPSQESAQEFAQEPTQKSAPEATDVGAMVAVKTSLASETVLVVETSLAQVAETSLAQTAATSLTQTAETLASRENQKSVTPKLKREILHRDQFFQFKDTDTGRVCGAKLFLEIDCSRGCGTLVHAEQ